MDNDDDIRELYDTQDDDLYDEGDMEAGPDDIQVDDPSLIGSDSLHGLVAQNFIEYSSYVIKERAIPDVDDGLKPVQRRILHTLYIKDDGRFNKVAKVVGAAMEFHPHGDQSIGSALVVLANKDYYIEKQGNFGDILTGTQAAAGRYIECRLSKLAKETLFNPDITEFVDSYDGRNKEPVRLPAKLPSLLLLGSDGIAVGMSTHIFPHNFRELLEAEIAILENRPFQLFPDFQQGGLMDVSEYADGAGKITLRARIEADGDKKIVIREIPATTTTQTIIASIEAASRRGKLKIAAINDYTSKSVAIELVLPRNVYAEETIKALYAYTDCQKVIKSDILVICDGEPRTMTVSEILHRNTERLLDILKAELEIERQRMEDKFHDRSLIRLFLEHRIYKKIENCRSLEKIMAETRSGLEAFRDELRRDITDQDIEKLLQIPIRRISRFDLDKLHEELETILHAMEDLDDKLAHLVDYTIDYIRKLLEKYGAAYARNTQIVSLDSVNRREIARKDIKVFHDKVNNFIGTAVKASSKDAQPLLCTEFDRLLLLKSDGTCKVIAITDKEYIGPTRYVFIVDKDQVYSIIYRDKKEGTWFCKRFTLGQFILNKEYQVLPKDCQIEALYTNAGVVVQLNLVANNRRSYNAVTVDFDSYPLRSREARGFKLTHYPVTGITVVNRGTTGPAAGTNDEADTTTPQTPEQDAAPAPEPAQEPEPAPESEPAQEQEPEPAPEQDAAQEPTPAPEAGRKLIDQDTPFFLE